jgi:hypothetical protein
MRRLLVLGAGVITLLLAGCGGTTIPMIPGGQANGGSGGQTVNNGGQTANNGGQGVNNGGQAGAGIAMTDVVGDWLGPAPGDTGSCGSSYGEWLLEQDGVYSMTDNSENCAGFTASGNFQLQGSSLAFEQASSSCGDCGASNYSVTISFSGVDSMEMCDVPADGICYTYSRQSS